MHSLYHKYHIDEQKLRSLKSEPFQSSCRRIWSLKDSLALRKHLRGKLQKSEVLLITSTLLLVRAQITHRNTANMHKTLKKDLSQ